MDTKWMAVIGEKGNGLGHIVGTFGSYNEALSKAKKECKKYYGNDGWYNVRKP